MLNKTLAILAFVPLATASAFAQNLVVNGTFDDFVPSSGTGGGWTASGNIDGAGGWRSNEGNPGGTFILNAGGGAPHPTISQGLTLVPGATYTLTGDYALGTEGYGAGVDTDFEVTIDGQDYSFDVPASLTDWHSFSETFVASSSIATLSLIGEAHGLDHDPRVDNISLTQAVPEPASMAALGLGALGLLRRRKRS